jgi:hypothetical protein
MHRIDDAERRRRLGVRHRLATRSQATDPVEAAGSLVGLHASDPPSVYLEARSRVPGLTLEPMQRALYDDRSLVRMIGMRRTLFVVPVDVAPVLHAACARAIDRAERRRLIGMLESAGIGGRDPAAWLAAAEADTLAALEARGEAVAVELSADVPALRAQIPFGQGRRWAGTVGVSTRVLFLLALEGRIVRGRPRGSWISGQYRWAPTERWLPPSAPRWDGLEADVARGQLVERWLRSFGPGTTDDLRWWTGMTLGQVRRSIAASRIAEVALADGSTGLVLADDLEPTPDPGPWVALLPGLDATVMGWKSRDWYLGPHRPALFDSNGNAGPTVWVDGRVVGGWGQRPSGEVAVQLLEDVGREALAAVEEEAARLTTWVAGVQVTPRFQTPLEKGIRRAVS